MNILIVSQYFWPENFRINDLALDLKKQGHQVTVLTGIPNYPEGKFFKGYGFFKNRRQYFEGMEIFRALLVPRKKAFKFSLMLNYFSFALFSCVEALFLYRKSIDVIFVFEPSPVTVGIPALLLKKILKAPILFWVQDLWPHSLSATGAVRSKSILNKVEKLTKFIYKGCDRILVQSKAFISSIEAMGIESDKIFYFPNSAEDIYQTISEHAIKLPLVAKANFCVMYAGNIGEAQSFETIFQAILLLKDYPEIHWLIVGEGRKKSWMLEQVCVHALNERVTFVDSQPITQMPGYYASADALLISLKRDPVFSLTIPSKVQSCLAAGRPLLASLEGEAARIITESESGLVSPPEDAAALAENVLRLYRMPMSVRAEMGHQGRRYFRKNFEKMYLLNQLENWLTEITGDSKKCVF